MHHAVSYLALHARIIPKHLEVSTSASSRRQSHRCQQLPFRKKRNPEDGPDSTHLLFLLLVFLVRGAHITYRHWRVTFDASYENGESVN